MLTAIRAGLAMAAAFIASAASAQQVTIDRGLVHGAVEGEVAAYLGIPYAAPPVGPDRWRAPRPAANGPDERDATKYAPDCAQAPFPPDMAPVRTVTSEDCLYLNIWTPRNARPRAKLPVMVWIHGGGFVNGGTSPAVYSGANFARDGVVLVSLNYRLGRYGFFAHPALTEEGFGGNFGFLDIIAGLRWVQRNVAEFGGDPANVTVFGESAGGMAVHMLLQSPQARGLFAKAIIQSGGGRQAAPSLAQGAQAGARFAPDASAAELRAIPAERVTGDLSLGKMGQPDFSGPMTDGRTVLGSAIDAARAGLYANVPVMIGATSADGFPGTDDKERVFASFGPDAERARELYDPSGKGDGFVIATNTSADAAMIEPARAIARALAPRQPVWLYRFAYQMPGEWARRNGGAPHASEIPYVFDTVVVRGEPMIPAEAPVAALTHRYWVDFARCGAPDCGGDTPDWPRATADTTRVQIIDGEGARHAQDPFTARLDFAEQRAAR